jgi:hypothetical protein
MPHTGSGPTMARAFRETAHLPMVIQLSLLVWAYEENYVATAIALQVLHSNLRQPQQFDSLTKLILFSIYLHEYIIVDVRNWYDNPESCKESFDAFCPFWKDHVVFVIYI